MEQVKSPVRSQSDDVCQIKFPRLQFNLKGE